MIRPVSILRPSHALATCGLALGLIMVVTGCATPPTVQRGRFVPEKTQTVIIAHKTGLVAELVALPNGAGPAVRLQKTDEVTLQKTFFFEKWLEYGNPNESSPQIRKQLVTGEYLRDTQPPEQELRQDGPLTARTVELAGTTVTTDENGICTNSAELIFACFDQLPLEDTAAATLQVRDPSFGVASLTITRKQLFDPLAIAWGKMPKSTYAGLVISAVKTEWTAGGLRITVSATNHNLQPAAMVVGRVFSREPWLEGRFFYFGNLAPGATATFSRTFTPPAGQPAAPVTAIVSLWNPNADDNATIVDPTPAKVQSLLQISPPTR